MSKLTKFTKIGQYRNVIKAITDRAKYKGQDENDNPIYDESAEMPVVAFKGTVKLHGTNASVCQSSDGNIWYQSRKNVITPTSDNAGFATFAESNKEVFEGFLNDIRDDYYEKDSKLTIGIFGEWCGGGIQKGVAINGLEKMFVVFAVKIIDEEDDENNFYLSEAYWPEVKSPEHKIYNIHDYSSKFLMIDFANPAMVQNQLVKYTEEVERECPVGKAFGSSGIGEGLVWVGYYEGDRYVFKTKGEKHSVSKVKTVASVDVEKLKSIDEFVKYSVTVNRLEQAIEQVFTIENIEPDRKKTGDYLRWIVNDIISEELDTLVGNGLEPKDVNGAISKEARKWFFKFLDEMVGL